MSQAIYDEAEAYDYDIGVKMDETKQYDEASTS